MEKTLLLRNDTVQIYRDLKVRILILFFRFLRNVYA